MINKIDFVNYKSFKDQQELELKPITILIGKNSSGKSAVAKFPVLIDNSFNNVSGEPYTIDYNDVQFGDEYRDVFYERIPNALLGFKLTSETNSELEIKLVSDFEKNTIPNIFSWRLNNEINLTYSTSAALRMATDTGPVPKARSRMSVWPAPRNEGNAKKTTCHFE